MKLYLSKRTNHALTRTDVIVSVLLFILIFICVLTLFVKPKSRVHRRPSTYSNVNCISNLKQIGLAARIWQGDNNNLFPMQVSVTNGGVMEPVAGGNAAPFFQVMSNELSTTKILVCPADEDHTVARNWKADFGNAHISYFVGLSADGSRPAELLSGDDNFAVDGSPVKSGLREISSAAPISWTKERHNLRGNFLMADGSAFTSTNSAASSGDLQMRLIENPNYQADSSDRFVIP